MMNDFRLIVAGSRNFSDYETLEKCIDKALKSKIKDHRIIIVSGTARGADTLGAKYATKHNYELSEYPAAWDTKGRAAGYIRNEEMAKNADALIAFWDGKSRGTNHMINIAKKRKLPIRIVRF